MSINPTFDSAAEQLIANGYTPVPLARGQKFPAVEKGWTDFDQRYDPAEFKGCGVGLLTGKPVVGADIDVRDEAVVKLLDEAAVRILGSAPLRIGLPREVAEDHLHG